MFCGTLLSFHDATIPAIVVKSRNRKIDVRNQRIERHAHFAEVRLFRAARDGGRERKVATVSAHHLHNKYSPTKQINTHIKLNTLSRPENPNVF